MEKVLITDSTICLCSQESS